MSKVFFLSIVVISFLLGYLTGREPSGGDSYAPPATMSADKQAALTTNFDTLYPESQKGQTESRILSMVEDTRKKIQSTNRLNSIEQITISSLVSNASDSEIEHSLQMFFDAEELHEYVDDSRVFASRLIEELGPSESSNHELSNAQIYLSLDKQIPTEDISHFEVEKNAKLYAHIQLNGALGFGDKKLYIRWKNKDSGEVLLFKQKSMNPSSDTNWISFKPEIEWEQGNYEVVFYKFNSQLDRLASKTYSLNTL